jgi:hypothetical protein
MIEPPSVQYHLLMVQSARERAAIQTTNTMMIMVQAQTDLACAGRKLRSGGLWDETIDVPVVDKLEEAGLETRG